MSDIKDQVAEAMADLQTYIENIVTDADVDYDENVVHDKVRKLVELSVRLGGSLVT